MSIMDRITGTKTPAHKKSPVRARSQKKELTVREEAATRRPATPSNSVAKGTLAHRILLRPIVSEKSAHLSSINQYQFEVARSANKIDIRKAIVEAYQADPIAVHVINVQGKGVTRGKIRGRTSRYRKAIVTMPKGTILKVFEGV